MAVKSVDPFRLGLSRWLFSPLQGTTLSRWHRALAANGYAVAPAFWPRAALTTASAMLNSVAARVERRRRGEAIAGTSVVGPLFILGHYRSGTTHLHNLLAADERFAFANNFQANFPLTFLGAEPIGARIGSWLTMRHRPHDNVALDLQVPTEDELALCADTLLSPHMAWHFPNTAEETAERYLTFRSASPEERREWIRSLRAFARKLTHVYGRRLVFKSPLHTARIPLLLEAFPDALFVHVHRDPYRVFQSTLNMERKVEPLFRYQFRRADDLEDRVLRRYERIYRAYLADRPLVPPGRLVEIAYRDLRKDPLATLERVYTELGLPDFADTRPAIEAYLRGVRGYRTNDYPPLPERVAARIAREWELAFREWGYPIRAEPAVASPEPSRRVSVR